MDEIENAAERTEGEDEAKKESGANLEGTTRVLEIGGRAILIAYGVGFFIDSYFDAKYGVTYLNPFRSRVAFTGIALLVQVSIILLIFTGEAIWRLASTFWDHCALATDGVRRECYRVAFAACWLIEATFLGLLMRFALTQRPQYIGTLITTWFYGLLPAKGQDLTPAPPSLAEANFISFHHPVATGISLAVLLTVPNIVKLVFRSIQRRWLLDLAAGVTVVSGAIFLFAEMQGQDSLAYSFVLYVLLVRVGMMAFQGDRPLRRAEPRLVIVALVIAIPVLYAERMYTNILPQWGGAPKIKLLIQFEHRVVPFGCTAPAYLLEETEEGYYLLRPDSDTAPAATANQQMSMDVGASACAPPGGAEAKPNPVPNVSPATVFNPQLYSAIFVPRREVFEVLYARSNDEP